MPLTIGPGFCSVVTGCAATDFCAAAITSSIFTFPSWASTPRLLSAASSSASLMNEPMMLLVYQRKRAGNEVPARDDVIQLLGNEDAVAVVDAVEADLQGFLVGAVNTGRGGILVGGQFR